MDPKSDLSWQTLKRRVDTDGVHQRDRLGGTSPETMSEAVKILKAEYTVRAIQVHKMDKVRLIYRLAKSLNDKLIGRKVSRIEVSNG